VLRLLENGKLDEAQAEKLRIEQVIREKIYCHVLMFIFLIIVDSCKEMLRLKEKNKL